MKSQTSYKTVVLTPGQEKAVDVTGSSFYIESVNGTVSVKFDDGSYAKHISGSFLDCEPGDFFKRITFRSDVGAGGVTLTVKYYAGTLKVGNRTPMVYTRPAPTYMVPYSSTAAAFVAAFDIPATNLRTGQTVADTLARVVIQLYDLTGGATACIDITKTGTATKAHRLDGQLHPWIEIETSEALTITQAVAATGYNVMAYYNLPT